MLSHPGPRACTLVALGTSSPFSPTEVTLAASPLPPQELEQRGAVA